jgi:hypothetical protein
LDEQGPPDCSPYPDYLKANAQIASDLSDEINAAVDYAQNKAKLDSLGQQLDSSQNNPARNFHQKSSF